MSDIGPHEATTSFEIMYDRPSGPPIEVDVEISGICYCDDPDWGIEARDITARIVGRELTEDEIEHLDLQQPLTESFFECEPCSPNIGEFYKGSDGFIWEVEDVCLTWDGSSEKKLRDRYVLLSRPAFRWELERPRRGIGKVRRVVNLGEFDHGTDMEGAPLFQWTPEKASKSNELQSFGESA